MPKNVFTNRQLLAVYKIDNIVTLIWQLIFKNKYIKMFILCVYYIYKI